MADPQKRRSKADPSQGSDLGSRFLPSSFIRLNVTSFYYRRFMATDKSIRTLTNLRLAWAGCSKTSADVPYIHRDVNGI